MIGILLAACLTCPTYTYDYATPRQREQYQQKVYDTLIITDMYKDGRDNRREKAEPQPSVGPDYRIDMEEFRVFTSPEDDEKE